MEVGFGPGHIVLDGDPAPLPQKGDRAPNFRPIFCGQTAGCTKMPLGMEVGLIPGDFVLDGDAALSPKRGGALQFSAHVYCGQTAAWIKMPLSTEVGLGLRDIVLDGDPAPPTLKVHSPQFSANVRCGQTDGWIKMPLGMMVGLGPGDFVFDGDPATPRKKGTPTPTQFLTHVYNGWMDEDATWYGSRPRPRPHCIRRVPALLERGTAAPRFSAYVYCGHGRPSQLLLSCCSLSQYHQKLACFHLHDLHHSPVKADSIYTV